MVVHIINPRLAAIGKAQDRPWMRRTVLFSFIEFDVGYSSSEKVGRDEKLVSWNGIGAMVGGSV